MSDLDLTEAVEAAARAIWEDSPPPTRVTWKTVTTDRPGLAHSVREVALAAVTATAAPLIEAQVRERVAQEIEAGIPLAEKRREDWITRQRPEQALKYNVAIETLKATARIARGGAS